MLFVNRLPSFPISDSEWKVELSCTWKDILEIRRVIYESVARLCYALKHLHWDMITSLAITTTKASTRPTSGTHSFLVVCASCTLGRLSAYSSAHQLKKHQNRRLPASDEWDSVRGQRLRTGWRPARRGKEGVPGRCARLTESRAMRLAEAHDTQITRRKCLIEVGCCLDYVIVVIVVWSLLV